MAWRAPKSTIPKFSASLVQAAARMAVVAAGVELVRFARAEADVFRRRILAQRFDSFKENPLAAPTLEKKRRYKRSLKVLVSTGAYARSIKALVYHTKGGGLTVRIGVPPAQRARDTRTGRPRAGVLMRTVAGYLEGGAPRAGIPARPHWAPGREALARRVPAERRLILRLALAAFRRTLGQRERRKGRP